MPPQTMPLVAEADVGEAGFFGRIWAGLKSIARAWRDAGRFITLEGGEGVGKSTQAEGAGRGAARRAASTWSRPASRAAAPAPRRSAACCSTITDWPPEAEALLFAAARADHVARTIRPALERGTWVVCDRFVDSSIAYQGGAGGLGFDAIRALHAIGSGGFLPDRTLLLAAPRSRSGPAAPAAATPGGADLIGGRGADYHRRGRRGLRAPRRGGAGPLPRRSTPRGTPEEVTARLLAALEDLL